MSGVVINPPITLDKSTTGVAYDPVHQRMFVLTVADNANPGKVFVIDTTTNSIIGSCISVGKNPDNLAYDPEKRRMYVLNLDGTVSVIDTMTTSPRVIP